MVRVKFTAPIALLLLLAAACSKGPEAPAESRPPAIEPGPARILHLYASPPAIARGETSLVCYGTEDAVEVRIDPEIERLAPALSRCIEASPSATTRYTLFAKGKDGREVSESLEVTVSGVTAPKRQAGGPEILFFTSTSREAVKGLPVTLCYGVANATSVKVEPDAGELKPVKQFCFQAKPETTTTYTLTASDGSRTDRKTLTIKVR